MRDLPYFKFMTTDYLGGDIQAHDMETQGIFINIIARAWKEGGWIAHDNKLARLLRVDKQVLASAIQVLIEDGCLIENDASLLSSKFILLQLSERDTLHDKRVKAGRKGGRTKHLNRSSKCQANAKQTPSIKESESESESEKEKVTKRKFQKPSPIEVTEYARSRNFMLDGEAFVDYYSAQGWRVGKNGMKDWKAAVRTWQRNNHSNGAKSKPLPMPASQREKLKGKR